MGPRNYIGKFPINRLNGGDMLRSWRAGKSRIIQFGDTKTRMGQAHNFAKGVENPEKTNLGTQEPAWGKHAKSPRAWKSPRGRWGPHWGPWGPMGTLGSQGALPPILPKGLQGMLAKPGLRIIMLALHLRFMKAFMGRLHW